MNAIYFTVMLLLIPPFSFGQNIDWAFANAKKFTDYSSEIDFGENSKVLASKFDKWKEKNADYKFVGNVVQIVEKENWIYGSTRSVVTKFRFIKTENFTAYQNYMSNMAEAERMRRERDNIEGAILLGLVLKGGYAIGKGIVKGIKEIDFSASGGTFNSNSVTKPGNLKADCIVESFPTYTEYSDGVKNNWLQKYDQYSIKFNDGKKGKIVYWHDDRNWAIYAPAGFSTRRDYQDYLSKVEAIKALYEWEKCGTISKKGKK